MERQSKHFVAMPVFSLEDGQQIGIVKDTIIDNKNLDINALSIEPKGFFKEQKIIPYVKVKSVGDDAITIERTGGAQSAGSLSNVLSLAKSSATFIGTKVVTETGLNLGYVEEFIIEDTTGKIVGFELGGKINGLLSGKARLNADFALTMGKDALIVKADSESNLISITPAMKDSLKTISDATSKWVECTVDNTKKWSKVLGSKLSKIASEEMPNYFRKKDPPLEEKAPEEEEEKKPPKEELF